MKFQLLFSGKIRKYFEMLPAECFTQHAKRQVNSYFVYLLFR